MATDGIRSAVRWLAVLPAALVGVLITLFPIHWVVMLIPYFDRPDDSIVSVDGKGLLASMRPELLERLGDAFLLPISLIVVGAAVAPRFKFQAGIALAILWFLLIGVALTLTLSHGRFEWGNAVLSVLGLLGIAIGLHRASLIDQEHNSSN